MSTITGSERDDIIFGTSANEFIEGRAGDDIIEGGGGKDTLAGGTGNDTYTIYSNDEIISELANQGVDHVRSHIDFTLGLNIENLTLLGIIGRIGRGNSLNNYIKGTDGRDYLWGAAGSDTLDGGRGEDSLDGGAGDDTYIVDSTGDVITEDMTAGYDSVISSISFTLGLWVENLTLTGNTAITGTGNDLNNLLLGNAANNLLDGKDGNDQINGGSGNDTLLGGAGHDSLYGDSGNDLMRGGVGDDIYIVDNILDVVEEVAGQGNDSVHSSSSFTLGAEVENLLLTGSANTSGAGNALNNVINGNTGDNRLDGFGGNDVITGNAGNDTLDGGLGNDTLSGGVGDDTYIVDIAGDSIMEGVNEGIDTVIASIDYQLSANLENLSLAGTIGRSGQGNALNNRLIGTSFNDRLSAEAGDDTIDGSSGNDTLIGGAGNDTYFVDSAGDSVIESANEGIDTVISSVDYTIPNNVENLTLAGSTGRWGYGNILNNSLIGTSFNDRLSGGAGADTLDGGLGNDSMLGGSGNDTYIVDNASDSVVESDNDGVDSVISSIDYSLTDNVENLTLTGPVGRQGYGNRLNNLLVGTSSNDRLSTGLGNDTLDGGLGNDSMYGGPGNDTYIVDTAGDSVIEGANDGVDTVFSAISYALGINLENLNLIGTFNTTATGNSANNVLIGNAGFNRIDGEEGNDTLNGGAGNDTLNGGAGNDTLEDNLGINSLVGGLGDDTYIIEGLNAVIENANEGNDTVRSSIDYTLGFNIENLILTGTIARRGEGNRLNNHIAGTSANDMLLGHEGNDTLLGGEGVDSLEGGSGADSLDGGSGNDVLRGQTDHDFLRGSSGDDVLWGDDGNDTLWGDTGNDTLDGGQNNDELWGGTGNDVILGADGNDTVEGEEGNDRLYGGAGNDRITGDIGNDYMSGDEGNDTIVGAAGGRDVIIGGEGFDVLDYSGAGAGVSANLISANSLIAAFDMNAISSDRTVSSYVQPNDNNVVLLAGTQSSASLTTGPQGQGSALLFNPGLSLNSGNAIGASLQGLSLSGSFTLSANVRFDDTQAWARIFDFGSGPQNNNIVVGRNNTSDALLFELWRDSTCVLSITGGNIFNWLWINVTVTYDAVTREGILYVNGRRVGAGTASSALTTATRLNNYVGRSNWAADGVFRGAIDNIAIFTRSLTAGEVPYIGTEGDFASGVEYVIGSNFADSLLGGLGRDSIEGGAGNDSISGLADNDTLRGGAGNDTVSGGEGNDSVSGDEGSDTLLGNEGDDSLAGGSGADSLDGGAGNDFLRGQSDHDFLRGSSGNDTLWGDDGNDVLWGDDGNDSLDGGNNNDALWGGVGDDVLFGNNDNDTLEGQEGNDSLRGGFGDDRIAGGVGNDTLWGDEGNDTIIGAAGGRDIILGGEGFDTLDYSGAAAAISVNLRSVESLAAAFDMSAVSSNGVVPSNFQPASNNVFLQLGTQAGLSSAAGPDGQGNALHFNPGSGINSSNAIGADLKGVTLDASFTLSADVRFDDTQAWARIFDFGNGAQNNNIVVGRRDGSNALVFELWNGSNLVLSVSGGNIVNGQWLNVTATYDAVTREGVLYVNGQRVAGGTASSAVSTAPRLNNYLGRSNWAADGAFRGAMDDIVIYNRSLEANEVQLLNRGSDLVSGIEHLIGSNYADMLVGTTGTNRIDGRGGNDTIEWQRGNGYTAVSGGAGEDTLVLRNVSRREVRLGLSFNQNNLGILIEPRNGSSSSRELISVVNTAADRVESIQFADGVLSLTPNSTLFSVRDDLLDRVRSGATQPQTGWLEYSQGDKQHVRNGSLAEPWRIPGFYTELAKEYRAVLLAIYNKYLSGDAGKPDYEKAKEAMDVADFAYSVETADATPTTTEISYWLTHLASSRVIENFKNDDFWRTEMMYRYQSARDYLSGSGDDLFGKYIESRGAFDEAISFVASFGGNVGIEYINNNVYATLLNKAQTLGNQSETEILVGKTERPAVYLGAVELLQSYGSSSSDQDLLQKLSRVISTNQDTVDEHYKVFNGGSLQGSYVYWVNRLYSERIGSIQNKQFWEIESALFDNDANAKAIYYKILDEKKKANNTGYIEYVKDSMAVPYVYWYVGSHMQTWNDDTMKRQMKEAYDAAKQFFSRDLWELSQLKTQNDPDFWAAYRTIWLWDYKWGNLGGASYAEQISIAINNINAPTFVDGDKVQYLTQFSKNHVLRSLWHWFRSDFGEPGAPALATSYEMDQIAADFWDKYSNQIMDRLLANESKGNYSARYAFSQSTWELNLQFSEVRQLSAIPSISINPSLLLDLAAIRVAERAFVDMPNIFGGSNRLEAIKQSASSYLAAPESQQNTQWRAKAENIVHFFDPLAKNQLDLERAKEELSLAISDAHLASIIISLQAMSEEEVSALIRRGQQVLGSYIWQSSGESLSNLGISASDVEGMDHDHKMILLGSLTILDSTLRTTVAELRSAGALSQQFDSESLKKFAERNALPMQGVISTLLVLSLGFNSFAFNSGLTSDAAGISKLVGESLYMLGLPFAFSKLTGLFGSRLPNLAKYFVTDSLSQGRPLFAAAFDKAINHLEDPVRGAITSAQQSFNTDGVSRVLSNIDEMLDRGTTINPDFGGPWREHVLTAHEREKLTELKKDIEAARGKATAQFGGKVFALADIAIGLGQVIDGARKIDTTLGKLGVATGSASVAAGISGLIALVARAPFALPFGLASAFLTFGGVLGFVIGSSLLGNTSDPTRNPLYNLSDDNAYDY